MPADAPPPCAVLAGRRGVALPVALALVLLLGVAVAALSVQRRSVTRRLDALSYQGRMLSVAEAALDEVSRSATITRAFTEDAAWERLRGAVASATLDGRRMLLEGARVTLEPRRTRRGLVEAATRLGDVEAELLDYHLQRRRGLLRLSVEVSFQRPYRLLTRRVVADHAYSLYRDRDRVGFEVSPDPTTRRAP